MTGPGTSLRRAGALGIAAALVVLALSARQAEAVEYDEAGNPVGTFETHDDGAVTPRYATVPAPAPGCDEGELQLTAIASRSGGGSGFYGPQRANDGEYGPCPPGGGFCWISAGSAPSGAWFMLEWPTEVTMCMIWVDTKMQPAECGANPNRILSDAQIQTWDGSSWVTHGSVSNEPDDWSFEFPTAVTTTRLRLYNVFTSAAFGFQSSNPVLHELKVYPGEGSGGGGGDCDLSPIEAKLDDEFRFTDDDEAAEVRDEWNGQLAALEAKLDDLNMAWCDVIRLLHTPSGIRSADCGGQHYEWNADGTLHD